MSQRSRRFQLARAFNFFRRRSRTLARCPDASALIEPFERRVLLSSIADDGFASVLLIDDQDGGFGTAADVLTGDGHDVTVVNGAFANGRADLLDADFLDCFDLVVWAARGDGYGARTSGSVTGSLEAYVQTGGNLIITGYDTLGAPDDLALAELVRSTTAADQSSASPDWQTADLDHFILNGPFGDFRNQAFTATGYDDDLLTADADQGAIALATTPGHSDRVIYTQLPFGGTVGYWNGGYFGTETNAQPDFASGGIPQDLFRNWVSGVIEPRGDGVAPIIDGGLLNDTGVSDADTITYDPTITGTITGDIVAARAWLDDADTEFIEITTEPSGEPQIIYVNDPGFGIVSGAWSSVGDLLFKPMGTGSAKVAWTFTDLLPGNYRVSATWPEHANRATDAPFTILDGGLEIATVDINQELTPNDLSDSGTNWEDLGGPYAVASGTLTIELTDDADEYVIAESIRVERIITRASATDDFSPYIDVLSLLQPDGTFMLDLRDLGGAIHGASGLTADGFEIEPNDDGIPGGSPADLSLANAVGSQFVSIGPDVFEAVIGGEIAVGGDGDWDFYAFNAAPGDRLIADLLGNSLGDPYVRLFDSDANQIAANDDSGPGLDSHLVFDDFPTSGEYYIVADSFGFSTGTYTLLLRQDTEVSRLTEGPHTLHIQAVDADGDLSEVFDLDFTWDLTTAVPEFQLDPALAHDPVSRPHETEASSVTLIGTAEPEAEVELSSATRMIDDLEAYLFFPTHHNQDNIIIDDDSFADIFQPAEVSPVRSWRSFGPAANGLVRATINDNLVLSDEVTGHFSLLWPDGVGFERSFATARYRFSESTDLSAHLLARVNMRSLLPSTVTHARLTISNETTTYHSTAILPITGENQQLTFKLTSADMFVAEGTDSFDEVVSAASDIGFTFQSLEGSYFETILFDDFELPLSTDPPIDPLITVADEHGNFTFENVPLAHGPNGFTARATDLAGNHGEATLSVIRTSEPPDLQAALANDTGTSSTDGLTVDPTITGSVTDTSPIVVFRAGFDDTAPEDFFDVLADVQPDGVFELTPVRLDEINGAPLADGEHTLHLIAEDPFGNTSNSDVSFTFDAVDTDPPVITAELANDTGASDTDRITLDPTITGSVIDVSELMSLRAGFGDTLPEDYVDILPDLMIGASIPSVDGLVAFYPFNGDATDESGNGHDGSVQGPLLTADRFGNLNSAFSFDGIDDFIEINDHPDLRLNDTDFTIGAWFYEAGRTSDNPNNLLSKRGPGLGDGWMLYANSIPEGVFAMQAGVGAPSISRVATGTSSISLNEWHHGVITYDASAGVATVYIDGNVDSVQAPIQMISPDDSHLVIGSENQGFPYEFDGLIDDIVIYDRALSPTEVAILWSSSDGSFILTPAQLEAINGGPLLGGSHTLHLQATDEHGNVSAVDDFSFTLEPINEQAKLIASDASAGDEFGTSVAISENIALVGTFQEDEQGENAGSAYLLDVTTGDQLAKLIASDAAVSDQFGWSVAISGNTAIVGARLNDDMGDNSGSAYLFDVSNPAMPVEVAKLTANDGAAGDQFGRAVAISGDIAIIGAHGDDDNGDLSGSAYLFDVTTGDQLFKLTAIDAAANDQFGRSVAISGDIAIIGAHGDNDNGDLFGSAYLFDVITGEQLAELSASDAAAFDNFGWSVAISGVTAIVGRFADGDEGSAYLFDVSDPTAPVESAKLTSADATESDQFGSSVAISGNIAIVGAFADDHAGHLSGSAHLFDVTTGHQLATVTASDATANDQFGASVSISGSTAIVGAGGDDDVGDGSGSAYLFAVPQPFEPEAEEGGESESSGGGDTGMTDEGEASSGASSDSDVTSVLLIDDQDGGFGTAGDILTGDGHDVTVVTGEFANVWANLLGSDFLGGFDLVVWAARGDGYGSETPAEVAASLENYIQTGGNLLITGYDSLGAPDDPFLADLVRSTTAGDQAGASPEWQTADLDHFILNGPFGDFRDQGFSAIPYDDDLLTADTGRGAVALATTPGYSDRIIFTELPFGGSVGYWNGGQPHADTNAQPDFTSGDTTENIFRNWVDGVTMPRGDGDAPVIDAGLDNDTGVSNTDGITFDPTITGTVTGTSPIVGFRVGFDDADLDDYIDLLSGLLGTQEPDNEGLLAYYPFDGNADDESGNGHNGAVDGAILTADRFGSPGSAYSFDGLNSFIDVPYSSELAPDAFTFSLWIQTDSDERGDLINSDPNLSHCDHGYVLWLEDGIVNFRLDKSSSCGGAITEVVSDVSISNGLWHHVAATYDGSMKLYVDGVLQSDVKDSTHSKTNGSIRIGMIRTNNYDPMWYYSGLIDDILIYDRALSGAEISELMSVGTGIELASDGSFVLDQEILNHIAGGELTEGQHTLHLQALDEDGDVSDFFDVEFTWDQTAPELSAELHPDSDSGTPGDNQTEDSEVTITGVTDPATDVSLLYVGAIVDDFEAYEPGQAIGTFANSQPWGRFGAATDSNLLAVDVGSNMVGEIDYQWISGGGFGSVRYNFADQTNLSQFGLARMKLMSDNPDTATAVRLSISNETTTYHSPDFIPLTTDFAELTFKLTEADVLPGDGFDSFAEVVSGATNIGFTFVTFGAGYTESIVLDDFALLVGPAPFIGPMDTTSDGDGNFGFDAVPLVGGPNTLRVRVADLAGNISEVTLPVVHNSAGPDVQAELAHDTGVSDNDGLTHDPTITGTISDGAEIVSLLAGFNDTLPGDYVDVWPEVQPDGSFTFDLDRLETINGAPLTDGMHTLHLTAEDEFGNMSDPVAVSFEFDSSAFVIGEVDAGEPRTLWVREADAVQMLDDTGFRDNALAFIEQKNIATLYIHADMYEGRNILTEEPEKFRTLVSELHARGIEAYAFFGPGGSNPEELILPENRADAVQIFQNLLDYNAGSAPDEQFDGVNSDIEPYLLGDWATNTHVRATQYLDLLAEFMAMKDGAGSEMLVGPAIPLWFSTIVVHWEGETKPLHEHVIDINDYITILDYRDFGIAAVDKIDGIVWGAKEELDYAAQVGKPVVIGVETGPDDPIDKVTFIEEGAYALERELLLASLVFEREPAFAGFAIHDLSWYRALQPPGAAIVDQSGEGSFGSEPTAHYYEQVTGDPLGLYSGDFDTGASGGFTLPNGSQSDWTKTDAGQLIGLPNPTNLSNATWTFTDLVPGLYRVSTTWLDAFYAPSDSVRFSLFDGAVDGTTDLEVLVDQTDEPGATGNGGFTLNGINWHDLAGGHSVLPFEVTGTTLTVQLTNDDEQFVYARSVRIELLDNPQTIDVDVPGFEVLSGNWHTFNGLRYREAGNGSARVRWTFEGLTPGVYQVATTWLPHENRASNAPYTIFNGTGDIMPTQIAVNQEMDPDDFFIEGHAWEILTGSFQVTGDALIVELSNDADQFVIADAVRIQRIGDLPDSGLSDYMAITAEDPGFEVVSGFWHTAPGFRYTPTGDGSAKVRWTFDDLTPGLYEVAATWTPHENRASDAPFTVYDGLSDPSPLVMDVNQEFLPSGDGDLGWAILDGHFELGGNTLVVELTDGANEWVIADTIRIRRIGAIPEPAPPIFDPEITTTQDPGFEVLSGFWNTADDLRYRPGGNGENKVRWTFDGLTPGFYRVSATWVAHANRASNAPFTIYDGPGDPMPLVARTNQELAPDDFNDQGKYWETLVNGFEITGDTLIIELSDDADEYVIADSIRIDQEPRILTIHDPGFEVTTGTWLATEDLRYHRSGSGNSKVQWTFEGLTPGLYQVAATWLPHANRASDAPFTIYDGLGDTLPLLVRTNQELTPDDFNDSGNNWEILVHGFELTGDTLVVELSDDANEWVIAESVRIEAVDTVRAIGIRSELDQSPDDELSNLYYLSSNPVLNDGSTISWMFQGLTPGMYKVIGSWQSGDDRATNALYRVIDPEGPGHVELATVNQQHLPAGFVSAGPENTTLLGQTLIHAFEVTGDTLIVDLSDHANGVVSAGPVQILRLDGDLALDPGSDTDPVGDGATTLETVTLSGTTVPNAPVELLEQGVMLDDFESYGFGENVESYTQWRPWLVDTNGGLGHGPLNLTTRGMFSSGSDEILSGAKSARLGITWPEEAFLGGAYVSTLYSFNSPTDLSPYLQFSFEASENFPDDAGPASLVRAVVTNGATTYLSDPMTLTGDPQEFIVDLSEVAFPYAEGPEFFEQVLNQATAIGLRFESENTGMDADSRTAFYTFDDVRLISVPNQFAMTDNTGAFTFVDVPLPPGITKLVAVSPDTHGNLIAATGDVTREVPPRVAARLANDTGVSDSDGVTLDPAILGHVFSDSDIVGLRAGFGDTPVEDFTDILHALRPDSSFVLDKAFLETINDGPLFDGTYTIHLLAEDAHGNQSQPTDVTFSLGQGFNRLIFADDLDTAPAPEWSGGEFLTTPSGRDYLGGNSDVTFDQVTLSLDDLPSHSSVTVEYDLLVIRTWDGNTTNNNFGPDIWRVDVAGGPNLINTTFTNNPLYNQAYPDAHPGGSYPAQTDADEVNTLGYGEGKFGDSVYRLSHTFDHGTDNLELTFSVITPPGDGEPWGLDNVQVLVSDHGTSDGLIFSRSYTGADLFSDPDISFPTAVPLLDGTSLVFEPDNPTFEKLIEVPLVPFGHLDSDASVIANITANATRLTGDYDFQFGLGDGNVLAGLSVSDNLGGGASAFSSIDLGDRWDNSSILENEQIFEGAGFPSTGQDFDVFVTLAISGGTTTVEGAYLAGMGERILTGQTLDPSAGLNFVFLSDDNREHYQINSLSIVVESVSEIM